jgi:ubiquinone/menaquinone biosynthesis C-methylase UbiE
MFETPIRPGGRVLDVGCGTGRDSVHFAGRGFDVQAIDASTEMLRIARSRGVRARQLPMQRLEARSAYDGIWAAASLIHLPKSEIRGVLRRLMRALLPSGVLFISLKEGSGEGMSSDGRFGAYYRVAEIRTIIRAIRPIGCIKVLRTGDIRSRRKGARVWINLFVYNRSDAPKPCPL